jgi:tetratricopeptide (TPR) repeat protein
MSADYSFNCIPLVESFADWRLIPTFALYASITIVCLLSLRARLHGHIEGGWVLLAVALMVVPFVPAMNIFVFVGTMVAERLLYLPSAGLCLLIGLLLARATGVQLIRAKEEIDANATASPECSTESVSSAPNSPSAGAQSDAHKRNVVSANARAVAIVCTIIAFLVVCGTVRTIHRNVDWYNEENLFMSALEVCPQSAKVHENVGVLYRRKMDFKTALKHFHKAQKIEPVFCDIDHWLGLTYMNMGEVEKGISYLKRCVDCKFAVGNCIEILRNVFDVFIGKDPLKAPPERQIEWGQILLRINFTTEAAMHHRDAGSNFWFQGKIAESIEPFKTALSIATHDEACLMNIHYWLARVFIDLKQYEEALAHSDNVLLCPDSEARRQISTVVTGIAEQVLITNPNHAKALEFVARYFMAIDGGAATANVYLERARKAYAEENKNHLSAAQLGLLNL